MKLPFSAKTKTVKAIGFSPDQLTDEPALQRLLTRRDVIALEQLHLLLSKVRLLCKERLTREGLNHLYEIADIGYRIPLRIRTGNEYQTISSSSSSKLSSYDRELLLLNDMLYKRLDKDIMYESKMSLLRGLVKKAVPVFLLVAVCSTASFILGRMIS